MAQKLMQNINHKSLSGVNLKHICVNTCCFKLWLTFLRYLMIVDHFETSDTSILFLTVAVRGGLGNCFFTIFLFNLLVIMQNQEFSSVFLKDAFRTFSFKTLLGFKMFKAFLNTSCAIYCMARLQCTNKRKDSSWLIVSSSFALWIFPPRYFLRGLPFAG